MGAEADASWIIDKGGYEVAYIGVSARVRDYARLGSLLANDGTLDGRPIIAVGWVREATTPSAKQFEPGHTRSFFGYGYQTWILPGHERQFVLRGLRGQAVFVDPPKISRWSGGPIIPSLVRSSSSFLRRTLSVR